jgi:hypothetical protein
MKALLINSSTVVSHSNLLRCKFPSFMQNRKKWHVIRGIFISVSRAHFAHGDLLKFISKYRVDSLISESFHIQCICFKCRVRIQIFMALTVLSSSTVPGLDHHRRYNIQVTIEASIHRFRIPPAARTFSALQCWDCLWKPHRLQVICSLEFFCRVQSTAAWPRTLTISSVKVKIIWSYTFQHPYACMVWNLINSRDKSITRNTVAHLLFYLFIQ